MKIETVRPILIFPKEFHIELDDNEFNALDNILKDSGWERSEIVELADICVFSYLKGGLRIDADWDNWTGYRFVVKRKVYIEIREALDFIISGI
jgi:hypothetical protein